MKQFVIDSASVCGEKAVIRGKDFHYLVHVRRCRVGSRFSVVDETGRRYEASVTVISPDECVLTLTAVESVPTEEKPAAELILIQCLPKAKKMDLIVRQGGGSLSLVRRFSKAAVRSAQPLTALLRWKLRLTNFPIATAGFFFTICRCRIRSGFMMRFPVRSGLCLLSVRKADLMTVKQRCCRKKAFGRFIWGGTF